MALRAVISGSRSRHETVPRVKRAFCFEAAMVWRPK
jgi:hypothetical protein